MEQFSVVSSGFHGNLYGFGDHPTFIAAVGDARLRCHQFPNRQWHVMHNNEIVWSSND